MNIEAIASNTFKAGAASGFPGQISSLCWKVARLSQFFDLIGLAAVGSGT